MSYHRYWYDLMAGTQFCNDMILLTNKNCLVLGTFCSLSCSLLPKQSRTEKSYFPTHYGSLNNSNCPLCSTSSTCWTQRWDTVSNKPEIITGYVIVSKPLIYSGRQRKWWRKWGVWKLFISYSTNHSLNWYTWPKKSFFVKLCSRSCSLVI